MCGAAPKVFFLTNDRSCGIIGKGQANVFAAAYSQERERRETRVESLLFLFYLDLFPTAAAGAARL